MMLSQEKLKQWTLEDFAEHYAETILAPPNDWGQHVSLLFGQSHHIIRLMRDTFGDDASQVALTRALHKAVVEHAKQREAARGIYPQTQD